jgi:protein-L-isoaspartate(D-aspartate) O-methyltransferase
MRGWVVPPPKEPEKTPEDLKAEREEKVRWLVSQGYLRSDRIRRAMLKVRREDFVPRSYRDYAYQEVPLPLPGKGSTISCPHSYPLFYEPLGLDEGHAFLEVGLGSGYGTALAREIVGQKGAVVSVEIDPLSLAFARENLERAGYGDVVLVEGDGGLGWPERAPYDRICVTAACEEIPPPLVDQLAPAGRLIAPVFGDGAQILTLLEKRDDDIETTAICEVLYVTLRGEFGASARTALR